MGTSYTTQRVYTKEENKNKSKIKPKRYYTIMYARDTRDTRARRPYQIQKKIEIRPRSVEKIQSKHRRY